MAIGIGVIGCGRIAQAAHLPALEKLGDFRRIIACDHSELLASGVAGRFQFCRHTNDPADVLSDDEVDAVLISVPDRFHAALVTEAIRRGKHVLVEKPLATSSEEAHGVAETAATGNVVVQVASMKRHDPGVAYAAEAVRSIGDILSFNAWYRVPVRRPDTPYFPAMILDDAVSERESQFKANQHRGPYVLATHGAHVFDTMRYLLGDFVRVYAQHHEIGADHVWSGALQLPSGAVGHFEILANVHGQWAEGLNVHGTRGTLQLRTHVPFARRPSDVRVYRDDDGGWTTPVFDEGDAYLQQLRSFAAAVRREAPPIPSVADGVAAVRLLEAVANSAESGIPTGISN